MAIANKTVSSAGSGSADPSVAHTPVGGDPAFAVVFVVELQGTQTVTDVDYGATAMTEISGSPFTKGGDEPAAISCFFLGASVPTGLQTVAATAPGSVERMIAVATYTAGDDCEILSIAKDISGDSELNPRGSIALSSTVAAVLMGFAAGGLTASVTALSGWAADASADGSTMSGHMFTYSTFASADVTTGWDQAADDALGFAVAVKEGVTGGTSTPKGPLGHPLKGPFGGPV